MSTSRPSSCWFRSPTWAMSSWPQPKTRWRLPRLSRSSTSGPASCRFSSPWAFSISAASGSAVKIESNDTAGGATNLIRSYGPMHALFYPMVLGYILIGAGAILYAIRTEKQVSKITLGLLFLPVAMTALGFFGNLFVGRRAVRLRGGKRGRRNSPAPSAAGSRPPGRAGRASRPPGSPERCCASPPRA